MSKRGVIEVLGLTVATPVVALALFGSLYALAWYGEKSGWAEKRTRSTSGVVADRQSHPSLAPFTH